MLIKRWTKYCFTFPRTIAPHELDTETRCDTAETGAYPCHRRLLRMISMKRDMRSEERVAKGAYIK